MTLFQFLYMMLRLPKKLSALTKMTLLACCLFLCTRSLVNLLTYLSTLSYLYFLLCPPTPRAYRDLLQLLWKPVPLSMMYCPWTYILSFITVLYFVMFRFGPGCFLFLFLVPAIWSFPPINVSCSYYILYYPHTNHLLVLARHSVYPFVV